MPETIKLVTQMRSGSHYLLYLLAQTVPCRIFFPVKNAGFREIDKSELKKGLYPENIIETKTGKVEYDVYFCHYYHEQRHLLTGVSQTINLIGFPFDSFYSDALAAADEIHNPTPSAIRKQSENYLFNYFSSEWQFLEPYMKSNSAWLETLNPDWDFIIRYEDFFVSLDKVTQKLSENMRISSQNIPKPIKNNRRLYWTDLYEERFDKVAFREIHKEFRRSIEVFYPEKIDSVLSNLEQ